MPAFVPAPKSMVSDKSAEQLALVNPGVGGTQKTRFFPVWLKPIETAASIAPNASRAQLGLSTGIEPLKVGEKRQMVIALNSSAPLGLAMLTLRFDPKVVRVTGVNPGTLLRREILQA
jgi:hypothetical protein